MIQKTIRDWGGVEFTTTEGAEQQTEWNDRTVYAVDGYNSIAELGANQAPMKVKTDFITVTQAVNLDTIESDTATNNSKVTYDDAAQVATNKTNADASKVITDFISITQAVNLDTVESDTATNNGKVSYTDAAQVSTNKTNADASKVITDFITVTQAVDLDAMETVTDDAALKTAGNTYTNLNQFKYSNTTFGNSLLGGADKITLRSSGAEATLTIEADTAGDVAFTVSSGSLDLISSDISLSSTIAEINANGDKAPTTKEWVVDSMVNSTVTGEPTGSDKVVNMVSLTQAEYNAGTPVATTFYVITDA